LKDKIIENGCCEVSGVDSYKYEFSKAIELTTFVQIVKMSSYVHPNDSMQITCDCDALDGFGKKLKLEWVFQFESGQVDDRNKILSDMTVGSIFFIKGPFCMNDEDGSITFFEHLYSTLPPEFPIAEIEYLFSCK
jgi:hypothetical protein